MSKIFISYRRADSADATGRLADRLRSRFGAKAVFLDIEDDRKGHDFNEYIRQEIADAHVVLVVIGRDWLGETGQGRRIDNPKDNVRIEVELALASGSPVIPVLVDGAVMTAKDNLPESIAELSDRSGIELAAGSGFEGQLEKLFRAIRNERSLWRNILLGRAGWKAYALIALVLGIILQLTMSAALGVRTTLDGLSANCSSQSVLICADSDSGIIPFSKIPIVASLESTRQKDAIELLPWPESGELAHEGLRKFIPKTCFIIQGERQCLTHPLLPGDYDVRIELRESLKFLWTQHDSAVIRCDVGETTQIDQGAKCQ